MANTTNYNWETPDDTDLVKDGALAIRTLGSSIDTTTKALNPSTTLGDIEYRSATANTNTRLGIGTTGQVLTVSGGVPAWTTLASGGGKVLQVVSATYSTATSTSSTSYSDTGLTVSITPSSSSSKVLVLVHTAMGVEGYSGGDYVGFLQLVRGSTALTSINQETQYSGRGRMGAAFTYLDSPATTSSTTYKTQIKSGNGSTTTTAAADSQVCSIVLLEIGA